MIYGKRKKKNKNNQKRKTHQKSSFGGRIAHELQSELKTDRNSCAIRPQKIDLLMSF